MRRRVVDVLQGRRVVVRPREGYARTLAGRPIAVGGVSVSWREVCLRLVACCQYVVSTPWNSAVFGPPVFGVWFACYQGPKRHKKEYTPGDQGTQPAYPHPIAPGAARPCQDYLHLDSVDCGAGGLAPTYGREVDASAFAYVVARPAARDCMSCFARARCDILCWM